MHIISLEETGEIRVTTYLDESQIPENQPNTWKIDKENLPEAPVQTWEMLDGVVTVNPEKLAAYHRSIMPSLSRRQFKLALLENGLLNTVEQMIESIEDPIIKARIQIEYSESERFERSNESVQYMLGVLNLTSDQVDEMWHFAMTL